MAGPGSLLIGQPGRRVVPVLDQRDEDVPDAESTRRLLIALETGGLLLLHSRREVRHP
jgi:hypothetical protein